MTGDIKNKKVLVLGLGILGGGVAAANWLLRHGAGVTITDLKTREQLAPALRRIRGKVSFRLGGHDEKDIRRADMVVVNPDVSVRNPFVRLAEELGKDIENEGTLFFRQWRKPIVAVTGTRGKTTTVNWLNHFLGTRFRPVVTGNSTVSPFLSVVDRADRYDIAAVELSSFILEFFNAHIRAPDIAVITNIYQDHLNRHRTLREYATTKANIFRAQRSGQNLVLNNDNAWTQFFLKKRPGGSVWFFSASERLPTGRNGVFYGSGDAYYQSAGKAVKVLSLGSFVKEYGEHNLENLLASALGARLAGCTWADIQKRIATLPQVPFRQETVFQDKHLRIINDTTATSPDGGIAAAKRFAGPQTVLITGGTDRDLDYTEWGKVVPECIHPENIIFLSGSATVKMRQELTTYNLQSATYETLKECLQAALEKAGKYRNSVIVFSPAAKSFEKFQNEFDRGKKFNRLVRDLIRRRRIVV